MNSGWRDCTLGDVLTFQRGFDLPKRAREEGTVPIISSSGVSGYHSTPKVKAPGVITGRYGTLGEVFYVKKDFYPLNTTLYVRDFKGNDPLFISYFLRTLNLENHNVAGAVPGLNRNALHLLPVRVPCICVQRKIAAILCAYDDLIENNQRRIHLLEEMAANLYREWFVYFRFPGHEKLEMQRSPLGEIPRDWLGKFPDYVDFLEGPGLRNWEFQEEGVPFLIVRSLIANDIDLSKVKYIDPELVRRKYSHFLLKPLDHVVSSSATLGRVVTIQSHHLPLLLNTGIIRMRPKTDSVGRWQLKHFLNSDYFQNQIRGHAVGVAQIHYGPSHLKRMWIVSPSDDIGRRYEVLTAPIEEMIAKIVRANSNLRKTRDIFLPKLISGDLDVQHLNINTEALDE